MLCELRAADCSCTPRLRSGQAREATVPTRVSKKLARHLSGTLVTMRDPVGHVGYESKAQDSRNLSEDKNGTMMKS